MMYCKGEVVVTKDGKYTGYVLRQYSMGGVTVVMCSDNVERELDTTHLLRDASSTATQMFERSKAAHTGKPAVDTYGLPIRIFTVLLRGGYIDKNGVNEDKLMSAVKDGSIWHVNGIGEVSVRVICAWLSLR